MELKIVLGLAIISFVTIGVDILNNNALGRSRTEPKGEGGGVWTFGPPYKAEGCNIKDNLPDNVYTKPYPPPP